VSKWTVACAAVLCLAGYAIVYATGAAWPPIRSDGFSYYVYLPSWYLFHDTTLAAVARDCCGGEFPGFTAIIRWPGTRNWVNAHPIGVAILQTPFFAAAHALTRWTNLSPDGFTVYYQHGAGLAGLFWTVAGLWVLRDLLLRHFSDRVTAATLVTILLGTNLYHYATYDSAYSHPYSFLLFAACLGLTERWYHAPTPRRSVLLGLVAGLIVLTRHTNVLFLVTFPLYGIVSIPALLDRTRQLKREWRAVALIVTTAALVIAPQLVLYYQATGRVLVSSYGELGFNWGSPRLFGVLFSVQKGLFFWSPVLLAACAGFLMLLVPSMVSGPAQDGTPDRGRTRVGSASAFVPPGLVFLAINTYVIASWWDWQFGGSYGHRGFVDALPLFAIGLAAWFSWAARHPVTLAAVSIVTAVAIGLSIFQMAQYWAGIVPFSDMTWEHYREVFLKWR
jgi:hypothetical protein